MAGWHPVDGTAMRWLSLARRTKKARWPLRRGGGVDGEASALTRHSGGRWRLATGRKGKGEWRPTPVKNSAVRLSPNGGARRHAAAWQDLHGGATRHEMAVAGTGEDIDDGAYPGGGGGADKDGRHPDRAVGTDTAVWTVDTFYGVCAMAVPPRATNQGAARGD
jgi:hypothetical protein